MLIIRPRPSRAPGKSLARLLLGVCLAVSTVSPPALASSTSPRAHTSRLITYSMGSALSAQRSCRNHKPEQCRSIRAHLARLQEIAREAPTITVSGATISWKRVSDIGSYLLASKVSGQSYQYLRVSGTSVTPQELSGKTAYYWVRTQVSHSTWSATIPINYPKAATSMGPQGPETSGLAAPSTGNVLTGERATDATSSTPQEIAPIGDQTNTTQEFSSASPSANFQPGLDSGTDMNLDLKGSEILGAKLVRIEWPIKATPEQMQPVIEGYASAGIRVLPLASFYGRIPTASEGQNLATWAEAYGPGGTFWSNRSDGQLAITSIEFGNETSYSYQYSDDTPSGYEARARTYALRFAEADLALRSANPGVGLLAQGDSGNAGSLWVKGMFEAVPNLGQLVAGWTIHPYGPEWRDRLETLIRQTTTEGAPSTIPIDITEWGLTTDNGRCLSENFGWNTCMTYQEAADTLSRTVSEMQQVLDSRLGLVMLYQVRDQASTGATNERESYFGALQHELQPKGAYTKAVEAFMAA